MADTMTPGHPGLAGGPIYLDHNATTPVDPRVADAALPYLTTHFGNPSSAHGYAVQPRRALAGAREAVAALIGAAPGEIVFTAGGSEADTLAVRGAVLARGAPADAHVITQPTEHPAGWRPAPRWPACTAPRSPTCPSAPTAGSTQPRSRPRSPPGPCWCRS